MRLKVNLTMEWTENIRSGDVDEMLGYTGSPKASEWPSVMKKFIEGNLYYAINMGEDSVKITVTKE